MAQSPIAQMTIGLAAFGGLIGCAPGATGQPVTGAVPIYQGARSEVLDGDLVRIRVEMTGGRGAADVSAYARCAAAQYTLNKGYGFARHVRTNVDEEGGVWRADAVYTISPALPRGLQTVDAEVAAADCAEQGIPTV